MSSALFLRELIDVFSFFLEGSFSSKSAQKVRKTFRRTAHEYNLRTHALTEEDGRYLPLSIRGFLNDGIVEKKRGDDHV